MTKQGNGGSLNKNGKVFSERTEWQINKVKDKEKCYH